MGILRSNIDELKQGDIALVGVPIDSNSSYLTGPAKAPELIVEAIECDSANFYTESLNDLNEHPRVKWTGNASFDQYLDIEEVIQSVLEREAIPFTFGGDHSITFPVIKAFAKKYPSLTILHFDAHGDLYDALDGNRHSHACPFARIMESGLADRLVQVGVRTMTAHQKEQVDRFGVEVIDMKSWKPDSLPHFEGPVYISFDMDVLDPAFAPGVSHHEPGGFSTREVLSMIQSLNADIVGVDVVEYNPDRDLNGVTGMVAAKVAKELLDQLI